MSILTPPSNVWATWQWPAEVVQLAASRQATAYLDPLREALARLFPTARLVRTYAEADPEIRDDQHIVFDVRLSQEDLPNYVAAKRAWHDELFRVCPSSQASLFRLCLVPLA
jgi:hypothetical protein